MMGTVRRRTARRRRKRRKALTNLIGNQTAKKILISKTAERVTKTKTRTPPTRRGIKTRTPIKIPSPSASGVTPP